MADAHIICRVSQAKDEVNRVLDLIEYVANVFGLKQGENYSYRLSLGDRADDKKYFKDDSAWDQAEEVLRSVLQERNAEFVEAEAEAAFYGPKIDIQMKNFAGKEDTAFTVQYDFVMPKRFELNCLNEEGKEEEAVVVHRSSIGAIERVMAFLIEHYAGVFPIWLSPVQVAIIPISDKHNEYAKGIFDQLVDLDIRVNLDDRAETMQSKIRNAQLQKVPYMFVVGDKEMEAKQISVRSRSGENQNGVQLEEFMQGLKEEILRKK